MSSPHKPLPKPLKVAKISVRPIWRKKLNSCHTSNVDDVNLPTQISKPQSPLNQNQPSQENSPTTQTNHDSLQSHSLPLGDNHTQPPLPPSPSREMLMNDINQLQDLSNLLAMHLSQRNTPSSPYSPNLPYTLNLDQVKQQAIILIKSLPKNNS
ncbi:hypothetical protein Tco_0484509 [Tanacetum coccineum]